MAARSEPAQIRRIFGQNLKTLAARAGSVSQLCRDLGINRTQFNRYLSGETHPRPDVLDKICRYFDLDARLLLEPLERLERNRLQCLEQHFDLSVITRMLARFDRRRMPDGLYRQVRPVQRGTAVSSLIQLRTGRGGLVTATTAATPHYLESIGQRWPWRKRRMHGPAIGNGEGATFVFTSQASEIMRILYFAYGYLGAPTLYSGFGMLTIPANSTRPQVVPVMLERIEPTFRAALAARRASGTLAFSDLRPHERTYFETWNPLGMLASARAASGLLTMRT